MDNLRKHYPKLLLGIVILIGVIWLANRQTTQPTPAQSESAPAGKSPMVGQSILEAKEANPDAEKPEQELTEEERWKITDRENLKKIHKGLFAYREKHGQFPEYLSQLVPEFVDAGSLVSPKGSAAPSEHADPGMEKPSYGYEFSNLEFRDGRTFEEIKDIQRQEWGDVVPMLRSFGYSDGDVINMAYGGELYETKLNWEWDPNTLNIVEKLGWGPGLEVGEFTEVTVTDASGNPVAGANVWADGRKYSFDLPNRPFATDENGVAKIPLGADLDRTALVLRVEGDGIASQTVGFERGAPPESHALVVGESQNIGGTLVDANGEPMADTWLYLKRAANEGETIGTYGGANLGTVKTDSSGNWSTDLHPSDAATVRATVATPWMHSPKFDPGIEIDTAAAQSGQAVIQVVPPAPPADVPGVIVVPE